jgi:adenylylsulfate kinase
MASKLNGSPRTIAVDFDGVIANYDGWKGYGVLGDPRMDVIEALRSLRGDGWKIVIYTTRGESEVRDFLQRHDVPHDEINRNSDYRTEGVKPVADVYWDDRAVCYSGDARKDLEAIRSFRTWSGRD